MAAVRYALLPVLTFVLTLSTWKREEQVGLPLQPQKAVEQEEEEVPTPLEDVEKPTEPQFKKSSPQPDPTHDLLCKSALSSLSGSLPLGAVFVLLLIHACGGENAELVRKLQESLLEKQELEDVLTEVKTELEKQTAQLKQTLEEVESQRGENKCRLQSVEEQITEKEVTFDKPEDLLREKESLLRAQWKLDEKKKGTRRQLLNAERLMEPIESTKTHRENMKV